MNTKKSIAQQALIYAPQECGLSRERAIEYWFHHGFYDAVGDFVRPTHIHTSQGSLSLEFADGSIRSMPHWQQ